MNFKYILFFSIIVLSQSCKQQTTSKKEQRPNILFCIADDWSYPHAGIYGDNVVVMPHFDKLAKESVVFNNAFTASPSCTPSRAAILTGQEVYRLEAGGLLFGTLPQKFPTYTSLLRDVGYAVGHTGKGYGPTDLSTENWEYNPAGKAYSDIESDAPEGMPRTDYAANFDTFLEGKGDDQPFVFWYGASEPHRVYKYGLGAEMGYDLAAIEVPAFLPDHEMTRNDVADYYNELTWFDKHLGKMIASLEENGMMDNTIIVVTSDNGMPFPRAKSTLYNYGVQMPLAIKYGDNFGKGRMVDDLVSLTDLAPTFLKLAGIDIPSQMTGKDLTALLEGKSDISEHRGYVVTALERHTICRPDNLGYPMRALHTKGYTYVHNFEPDRTPGGDGDFDAWPQGFYGDVDDGASKTLFEENPDQWPELFDYSFGQRPREELFDVQVDLVNMNNLADDPAYNKLKEDFKKQLFDYLKATHDPRMKGLSPWDEYAFTGGDEWQK